MENQSAHHSQHGGMSDQGFRPFMSPALTEAQAQQHASSSVNTAPVMVPITASAPAAHSESGSSICPADGYIWKGFGLREGPDSSRLIYYVCAEESCMVEKSVVLSQDGQVIETLYRGRHNHHPLPSNIMWPRDGLQAQIGYGPGSQVCAPPEVYAAGISVARAVEEDDQLLSSGDSEEDDDGEPRTDGPNDTERGALVSIRRNIGQILATETLDNCEQGANSHQRKRGRSKKSMVWDHFTDVRYGGEVQCAECNHCKKRLSGNSKGGTSHLRRHLKTCPARLATGQVQVHRSSSQPGPSVWKNSNFDQDKSLELLTKALVSNLCSFSFPSSINFRQFLTGISPTNDLVPQVSVEEKFLSIFQNEKKKLQEQIVQAPGGVFLTVKRWDLEQKCLICVMAHFIDKEWNMSRKIIRYSFLGCYEYCESHQTNSFVSMFPDWQSCKSIMTPKTMDEAAAEILKEVVQSWNLRLKLLGLSSSPASLYDKAILHLEKMISEQNYLTAKHKSLTLPCIICDLCGLVVDFTNDVTVQTSQSWFEYMTCSDLRRNKYKEILSQLQIDRPSFGSQNWHLALYILDAALHFDNALPDLEKIDSKFFYPRKPSSRVADNFCRLAMPFYRVVKAISSPYATLNSHFHAIWDLRTALQVLSEKDYISEVFDVYSMQEEFDDKLWSKWYLWLSLAVVLDPRYKIRFIIRHFQECSGSDAKRYINEVRGKLYELFFRYSCHVDQQNSEHRNQGNNDLHLVHTHGGSALPLPAHDKGRNDSEQSSGLKELGELYRYLEGECIPQTTASNFDILRWWKDNASTYPALARMARDILAIPACTCAANSELDVTDERVMLFFNRKMSHEAVEALICTQDWIKSSETNDQVVGNRSMPA